MARIKAVKVEVCSTRAEFEAAVDAAAKCSVQREKLVAALKARHQAIDDKYGAEIKALDADIKNAHERAAPYFEAHAGELCAPGRRNGSTKLANFGVRLGLPTVTKAGRFKKVAWKALGIIFDGIDATSRRLTRRRFLPSSETSRARIPKSSPRRRRRSPCLTSTRSRWSRRTSSGSNPSPTSR